MEGIIVAWLIFGAILMVLEFLVPGAILSFLGLAAVVVAGLYHYGPVPSFVHGLIYWFIISLVLVFTLRSLVLRFMPSDHRYQPVDEDDNAIGALAQVVEEILPGQQGRIRFRGTTWQAACHDHCSEGSEVVIAGREGNAWQVEFSHKRGR